MRRRRFTQERIIGILREHEAGAKTADLARKHGRVRSQTVAGSEGVNVRPWPPCMGLLRRLEVIA